MNDLPRPDSDCIYPLLLHSKIQGMSIDFCAMLFDVARPTRLFLVLLYAGRAEF
jgi:hypothetical protein